jgi:hypothetical protein
MEKEGWGPRGMEACGQDGRGPTWAVAPTRRWRIPYRRLPYHSTLASVILRLRETRWISKDMAVDWGGDCTQLEVEEVNMNLIADTPSSSWPRHTRISHCYLAGHAGGTAAPASSSRILVFQPTNALFIFVIFCSLHPTNVSAVTRPSSGAPC